MLSSFVQNKLMLQHLESIKKLFGLNREEKTEYKRLTTEIKKQKEEQIKHLIEDEKIRQIKQLIEIKKII